MAVTNSIIAQMNLENRRGIVYRIVHDGSTTTTTIAPGLTYPYCIGGALKETITSSATGYSHALTFTAGTNAYYSDVLLINN